MRQNTIVDVISCMRCAGRLLAFTRGRALFYGKIKSICTEGGQCMVQLSNFSSRRTLGWESKTDVDRNFMVPADTKVKILIGGKNPLAASFKFFPWRGQGDYSACICDPGYLNVVMKQHRV